MAMFAFLPMTSVVAQSDQVDKGLQAINSAFPETIIQKDSSPTSLIKTIIQYALYLSAIVAVGFVIYGGFLYMTSGGKEDQAKNGRNTLVNALIGLVIIVLSYVIVEVVYRFITTGTGNSTGV